ncbi:MAG: hypothetical protein K0S39_3054 [Paenibacillus sp.]|jgi:hypothetical protein|nr:hypothetical protein [Paenibacillus sp.]
MFQIPVRFFKLCGWSLFIGGVMGMLGQILHAPDVPGSVASIPEFLKLAVNLHVLLAFSSTFILLGLPAVFLRQASSLRWWGWLAFPLLFIGLMLEIFHGPVQIFAYPLLFGSIKTEDQLKVVSDQINNMIVDEFPLQLLVVVPMVPFLLFGFLLFGISMLYARLLPKGCAIFILIVLALLVCGNFIKHPVFDYSVALVHLIFIWLGLILAFERLEEQPVQRSSVQPDGRDISSW